METIQIAQNQKKILNKDSTIPKKRTTDHTELEMMELSLRDYEAGRYKAVKYSC